MMSSFISLPMASSSPPNKKTFIINPE
jgi:hypothetical protein